ncbi:hypothetical protein NL676_021637 [Syzygium grande]|nr:hypothetical protein NL676_021637 [Syzygium grande]
MVPPHFLFVTCPNGGAISPALQLAERLTPVGSLVTFFTTVFAYCSMIDPVCLEGVTFATFSDGYDNQGMTPSASRPRRSSGGQKLLEASSTIVLDEALGSHACSTG